MNTLYLDLETIPSQKPGARDEIRRSLTPPASMTKQETIDKWWSEKADEVVEEKYLKTSLDGARGEIVVLGFAIDDREPESLQRVVGIEDEAYMLQEFFAHIACQITGSFQIVGHNVRNFDLRFLFQRCVINGVMPTFNLRHEGRYNDDYVFDTMLAWAGWNNYVKLQVLIETLGIDMSKGGMDGSQVWGYIQAGRLDDVAKYCRGDIARTREVFKRLTFKTAA